MCFLIQYESNSTNCGKNLISVDYPSVCSNGKKVKYFRTATLVNQLTEAKAKGDLQKFIKQINKADLLVCDEWGYVPFEKEGS